MHRARAALIETGRARGVRSLAVALLLLAACPPKRTYPDGRGIEGQLEREIIAMRETMRMLEAEAKTCQEGGVAGPLYAELHQILVSPEVVVSSIGPVTTILMPDTHLFGADAVSVREEAYVTLDLLGTALKEHPDMTVVIEGHTADRAPPLLAKKYTDLFELGYLRARLVRDALVMKFDVPEEMITLSSRGPHAPVASNDTAAGQARNARVVVYVYPPGMR